MVTVHVTVPLKEVKDLIAGGDFVRGEQPSPEAVYRDTKEHPLLGPSMANIPGLDRQLPVSPHPLTSEPLKADYPMTRQLTGLSLDDLTPIEQAVAKSNVTPSTLYPHTGIPEYDRSIVGKMGPRAEQTLGQLLASPVFQRADQETRNVLLHTMLGQVREVAQAQTKAQRPDLERQRLQQSTQDPKTFRDLLIKRALAQQPGLLTPPARGLLGY